MFNSKCWHWWVGKAYWQPQQMALSYHGESAWKGKSLLESSDENYQIRRAKKKTKEPEWIIIYLIY